MTMDLEMHMDEYLPLRDVVFNVLLGDSQLLGGVDRRHDD